MTPKWSPKSPKMMPTWLYRQDFAKFSLNRHYNGTLQAEGGSVMVWSVRSWRDMELLIRLDTTLTGDRYVSILSDHLHPLMSIVHSDNLESFSRKMRRLKRPELLQSGSRDTLLNLDTSAGHQNPQT
ncbi:uncharacterized protein TNCV_4537081 [Trichonephila clavipes]|nr:uncharacterized protein TNCV_4537081 [Trichonephila clavipes]